MRNLWTTKQAAEFLGVKPATVYSWVKQRKIPHIVLSRGRRKMCVRFRPDQLEAWIDRQAQKAAR